MHYISFPVGQLLLLLLLYSPCIQLKEKVEFIVNEGCPLCATISYDIYSELARTNDVSDTSHYSLLSHDVRVFIARFVYSQIRRISCS